MPEIRMSDEFAFGNEAADVSNVDGYETAPEDGWDEDPADVLERIELASGVNCFGQPIN